MIYNIFPRIHAEFQINEPPNFPFWFTPAQFTGNIVISKDGTHVEHFALFVPNDKKLNVGRLTLMFRPIFLVSTLLQDLKIQPSLFTIKHVYYCCVIFLFLI